MPSILPLDRSFEKKRLARSVYLAALVIGVLLTTFLIWSLREMILPVTLGILLAYLFQPLVKLVKVRFFPYTLRVFIVFFVISFALFLGVQKIRESIPDEKGKAEMILQMKKKLNDQYRRTMELNSGSGNLLYRLFGKELDPLVKNMDHVLSVDSKRFSTTDLDIGNLLHTLSLWMLTPLVFLFLLFDQGQILRFLIGLVPNRYFELSLTIVDEVDQAIGRYLRGTMLECALVGLTMAVGFYLVGFEWRAAVLIGAASGFANAIPFLGTVIGLFMGLSYALIAPSLNPWIPGLSSDHVFLAVAVVVAIVHILDNAIYAPVVLAKAVSLHPLVVVLGVVGASMIFGFAGMLLAVPAIVVAKVTLETLFQGLRAYNII